MKRVIIALTAMLGYGAMTFALSQPRNDKSNPRPTQSILPTEPTCETQAPGRSALHSKVAKLRAEVELLQLEHDASRALLAERFKGVVAADSENIGEIDELRIVTFYMRMGAERVGRGAEFDKLIRDDGSTLQKTIDKAREIPTELNRKKDAFFRLSIELNQKKIELVELETQLEGSM